MRLRSTYLPVCLGGIEGETSQEASFGFLASSRTVTASVQEEWGCVRMRKVGILARSNAMILC